MDKIRIENANRNRNLGGKEWMRGRRYPKCPHAYERSINIFVWGRATLDRWSLRGRRKEMRNWKNVRGAFGSDLIHIIFSREIFPFYFEGFFFSLCFSFSPAWPPGRY